MARKRSFDTQAVLQKILFLFWEKGYENTTIKDIDNVSGIKRTSLYNAFESKNELFKDVLRKYREMVEKNVQNFLKEDIDSIKNVFYNFLRDDWDDNAPQHFGCLMVNTSTTSRTLDNSITDLVRDYEVMWRFYFLKTLKSASSKKQIKDHLNLDDCAEFLVSVLFGTLVRIRLAKSLSAGSSAAKIVFNTLDSWKI